VGRDGRCIDEGRDAVNAGENENGAEMEAREGARTDLLVPDVDQSGEGLVQTRVLGWTSGVGVERRRPRGCVDRPADQLLLDVHRPLSNFRLLVLLTYTAFL
jgi:hypothetical protein